MTFDHVLHGCAPVPLAGYLKALGVFRLVAEQTDPDARGFWCNERFVLRTTLGEDELVRFFLECYQPTPVLSPWSGGSGFWPKDNTEGIAAIEASNLDRLATYRQAIRACRQIIMKQQLTEAPKDDAKAALLAALRSELSDPACQWLDGAIALTADGLRYPPLLGTGGNDGRLDFSNNFMRRLASVMGSVRANSAALLRSSLFSEPCNNLEKGAVGQFAPGNAGGVNAGTGFESDSQVNPWDFLLTVEGALMFAAASTRRHAQDRDAALAFPFTTRTVGAGSGATAPADEANARPEFWAPLWQRPSGMEEIQLALTEGRAVLDRSAVRDGLDFARAAAQLGISRGIGAFQRYGFLMRAGKAYFATPLGRIEVRENPRASLISELEQNGWLSRARKMVRDNNAPTAVVALGRSLDDALFRLAADNSNDAVQAVLMGFGVLAFAVGNRPKLQGTLLPPPSLTSEWIKQADDRSCEFELAAALSGLRAAESKTKDHRYRLPFRRHLAALATNHFVDEWDDTTESKALAVWSGRNLARDLAAILERRLVEAQRHAFVDPDGEKQLPLWSPRPASLAAVSTFLAGSTNDDRIAALAAGLGWVRSVPCILRSAPREEIIPYAYAALKPLFAPEGVGYDGAKQKPKVMDPLPLVRLLRAGRVGDALALAHRLARGAGLAVPFADGASSPAIDPLRLTAALVLPISRQDNDRLVDRAYPSKSQEEQEHNAA